MRRNAGLFVLISIVSGFGSTTMSLAASLWVLDLSGSVGLAGLTGVCIYLPTFLAPWLGAIVDRLPRRPLVIGIDLALGATMLILLAVHQVWMIFAVLLARGIGFVLADAGESALLPSALPPSLLGRVNGWRSSAQEGMKLVAPLAGAGLYAWRGAAPVILVSAVTPLIAAVGYALVRLNDGPTRRTTGRTGVKAGVTELFRLRDVRVPVLVATVAIAMSGLTGAPMLGRVVHGLHLPATYMGYLGSAQGAGSIVGGLLVGPLLARMNPTKVAALGAAIFAGARVLSCVPSWPIVVTGSVLIGIGLPWPLIAAMTAVQTETPDHLLGRVSATSGTLMFGPVALAIPLGSASVLLGSVPPMLAASAITLVAAGWALRSQRRANSQREPVGQYDVGRGVRY